MKPVQMSIGPYSSRLMMQDAVIVLAPTLLLLIGSLWIYWNEWSHLVNMLASVLPY